MEALTRPKLSGTRLAACYLALLAGGGIIFWLVTQNGQHLQAGAPPLGFGHGSHHDNSLIARLLLALAVIMASSQALGKLMARFQQPPVMGEVLGGILLGPSLLGWVWPQASALLFAPDVTGALGTLARIGVILYMFFVGLELDWGLLRHQGKSTLLISHASIVLPFSLGALLSLWLYPLYAGPDVPFHVFTLFLGVSMSVTAFPVLARILTDQNMQRSRLGALALTCAAVDDVTAWCLLACVLAVATSSPWLAVQTLLLSALFVVTVLVLIRPVLQKLTGWQDRRQDLGIALICSILAAASTEAIGIHALFGAFLLGAVIPHDSKLAKSLMDNLNTLVSVLLLPAFFAFTGLRTSIGLVQGPLAWASVAAVIAAACLGKFGGTWLAARACGIPNREAASLGVLMNTRGLMELIVLNLGLELKILSPTLFTIFVLMALATTFSTTPILIRLRGNESEQPAIQAA
ncbi:MAG: cation:proton antiporter [Candidatus Eremiobacteraeota bacterium]|nr:cation:proton antiporter [Candidatus Eremiobacteraeota bacterium]MCW5871515.1 cation:proton antiporter [Candidatus Eremiobacteraeota bacterium]